MGLRYCSTEQIVTNREGGEVIIPMTAFIEGGMTLPMGRITRNYLINHRLCPHQCAPNMFRILGCVDAFNEHLQLGLTWHDVVHLYECHSQVDGGFYLKSRSPVVRLILCLPKSNKGMKDDYLITSGDGTMVSTAPPKRESQVGYLRVRFLSKTLQILQSSSYSCCSLFGFILKMGFRELTMALFLAVFADRRHVAPRLNFTNVAALNYLLQSDIFVSEDR